MRKTLMKWLLLIFLFAYVTAVTVWAHGEASRHACKGFEVEIKSVSKADSVTERGVTEELMKYPRKIKGVPMAAVNTLDLERYLSKMSNFEDVECTLTTDGFLRVTIVPMVPEIRVFDGPDSYYINKDGKRIESKASFFVDVPVVKGTFTTSFTPRDVLPVTRFVQNDPVLRQLVAMTEARDADNIILVPRIHGHVVNFGDTTRLEEKRKALLAFYRKVMPYKGWWEYDTLSLKFRGQIVASRRDKTPSVHGLQYEEEEDLEEATLPVDLPEKTAPRNGNP